ncbi:MAG: NADH-quinone oxidoreductase subunit B family protein [Candidatus Margulisiibacteriota bacterium]
MKNLFRWGLKKSLWVFHLGASACNNCDIEILDALTPRFDVERFGIVLVGSPRHADVLLVSGIVNRQSMERVKRVYEAVPKPKLVVAIGACAQTADMFRDSYNYVKPVDEIIPVDVYVPGCPPKPEAIIAGVVKALEKIK